MQKQKQMKVHVQPPTDPADAEAAPAVPRRPDVSSTKNVLPFRGVGVCTFLELALRITATPTNCQNRHGQIFSIIM